jgi:hypothetical protein
MHCQNPMKQRILLIALAMLTGSLTAAPQDDVERATKTKEQIPVNNIPLTTVSVRYMVDDVAAAVAFTPSTLALPSNQILLRRSRRSLAVI